MQRAKACGLYLLPQAPRLMGEEKFFNSLQKNFTDLA
jgi:hypothetical protein